MRRWLRGLGLLGVAWLVSACATGSFLAYKVSPDYPRTDVREVRDLPHLHAAVTVWYDGAGVPHVQANDEHDLMLATGWLHGRERYFEMDLLRRLARGRLSELVGDQPLLGATSVGWDLAMRAWGFEGQAADDARALVGEDRALMNAYVEGVNAGLAVNRPLEYRLLRLEPERWTLEDSFVLGRLNAWSVTHNWHQELSRLLLALHGGLERSAQIYGHAPWPEGWSLDLHDPARPLAPAVAPELFDLFPPRPYAAPAPDAPRAAEGAVGEHVGSPLRIDGRQVASATLAWMEGASNAWAVGGEHTVSGKPLLANDPHLSHVVPSLVVQQHLSAPGLDVIGVTTPGLPWVLAGHNARVAWGMTSTVGDVIDLVIERVDPADPKAVHREGRPSEPIAFEAVVVRVRDGGTLTERRFTVRRTSNGPLVNDMYPGLLPAWAPLVALRWHPTGGEQAVVALRRANRAASVPELMQALGAMPLPVTTWTAADVEGRVALFATGAIPVRRAHRGTFPVPGWLSAYDWDGVRGPEVLVGQVQGAEARLAHGNNLMSDPARQAVPVAIDTAPSYRFERILERLKAVPRHDAASFAAIQTDVHLVRARRLVPHLIDDLRTAPLSPVERQAFALLVSWDFEATVDSPAAALFFATYRHAVMAALQDELDAAGFTFVMGQRYSTNVADEWLCAPGHVVWDRRDTPAVERRTDAVVTAFRRAVADLQAAQGPDPAAWAWGKLHDLHPKHAFGSRDALAGLVNLPPSEAAGGLDSVWKSHFDLANPDHPFRAMAGPVLRMVVDLDDPAHGQWIIDTGASGWPGSPHYGDQHELWRQGKLLPMLYDWDEVRKQATGRVVLVP
jgi:penicillin amidase